MTTQRRWTEAERDVLYANFRKLTYEQIGELLGRSWTSVRHQARMRGLTQRSNLGRKFSANLAFFANPNPLNSYWAGFIAADGCVHGKRLQVKLGIKDADHVARLASDLGYTGPLQYSDSGRKCGLQVSCDSYVRDLAENFSITPHKSLTLKPPNIRTDAEVRAFITGLIDGDGCISENRYRMYVRQRITIYGTAAMLEWVRGYFDQWSPPSARQGSGVYRMAGRQLHAYGVTAGRAIRVGNALREVDVPRLARKWERLPTI